MCQHARDGSSKLQNHNEWNQWISLRDCMFGSKNWLNICLNSRIRDSIYMKGKNSIKEG
jgi:hypothetical protein